MTKTFATEGYKTPAIEVLSIAVTRPIAGSGQTTIFEEGTPLPGWDLPTL